MFHSASRLASLTLAGFVAAAGPVAAQGVFEFISHPVPDQPEMTEGLVDIGGLNLWYTDTGGTGEVVLFLHPATVAGDIWLYQFPVLAEAGYRVVAFSRRGYRNSDVGPEDRGTAAEDMARFVDGLGLETFHIVSAAAGGIYAADYALSYPERVSTVTICCSLISVGDREYMAESMALRPQGFNAMPGAFQELGPGYRAGNPEGTALWTEYHEAAIIEGFRQGLVNNLTLEALQQLTMPVLLIAGDSDLYTPPAMMHRMAVQIPNSEDHVVDDAGHVVFWEQPEVFNALLLDFLSRH